MALDREAIFVAAFARLRTAADFVFTSRVFQSWDDTPPAECPAMFFTKGPEDRVIQQGMPPLIRMTGLLMVYVRNDADPEMPASTLLNELLTSIDEKLEYAPTEGQVDGAPFVANPYAGWGTTLGGLVSYCRIADTVDVFEGVIGGGAAAIIPIEMLSVA